MATCTPTNLEMVDRVHQYTPVPFKLLEPASIVSYFKWEKLHNSLHHNGLLKRPLWSRVTYGREALLTLSLVVREHPPTTQRLGMINFRRKALSNSKRSEENDKQQLRKLARTSTRSWRDVTGRDAFWDSFSGVDALWLFPRWRKP